MANIEASSGAYVARRVVCIHAGAAPGANTNAFTAVTPTPNCCAWRLSMSFATTTKVDIRVTDGTTAYSIHLFANADCTASCEYTATIAVAATSDGSTALTYSLRVQTDSVIQKLIIDEICGPVL